MGCRFFGGRSQEFQYIIEVACVHLSNFCWIMRVDESGDAIGMLQMWSLQEAHTHSYTIRVWVAARRIKLACKWYRFVVVVLTSQLITKSFGWEPKVSEEHAGYFVCCFTFIFLPDTDKCSRTFRGTHVNDTLTLQHLWQFSHLQNIILVFFSEKKGTPEKTPFIHSHFFHHALLSGEGISSCRQAGCGLSESKSRTQGALRTPSALPGQVAEGWFERRHGRYLSPCKGCGVFAVPLFWSVVLFLVSEGPAFFVWDILKDSGRFRTGNHEVLGIMGFSGIPSATLGCILFAKMYLWWKLATQQAIDNSDSGNSEGDELLYDIACFYSPHDFPLRVWIKKQSAKYGSDFSQHQFEIENKLGFNGISYNYQYLSISINSSFSGPVPGSGPVELPKLRSKIGIDDRLFAKVTANADVKNSIILVHPTCGPTQPGDIDGPTRHLATGTSSCCFSLLVGWLILVPFWWIWGEQTRDFSRLLGFYFEIL